MGNARESAVGGLPLVDQAVDWFVENAADRALDLITLLRWERWCSNAWNRAEYAEIVGMQAQALLGAPPSKPSREALVADMAADTLAQPIADS
jgi:hypothetical protein